MKQQFSVSLKLKSKFHPVVDALEPHKRFMVAQCVSGKSCLVKAENDMSNAAKKLCRRGEKYELLMGVPGDFGRQRFIAFAVGRELEALPVNTEWNLDIGRGVMSKVLEA